MYRAALPTQYVITPGADAIVPGTTDTANHTDDGDYGSVLCRSLFKFRGQHRVTRLTLILTDASTSRLANEPGGYVRTQCLPALTLNVGPYDFDDHSVCGRICVPDSSRSAARVSRADNAASSPRSSGVEPNRIFNIEWRNLLFNNNGRGKTAPYGCMRIRSGLTSASDVIIGYA